MIVFYLFVLSVSLLVCVVALLFIGAQVVAIFTTDAPFVPIPGGIDEKIIETLKLGDNSVLYELGCGDARVLRKASEKYPGIKMVGVEIAFIPYLLARVKSRKYRNIKIKRENIFRTHVGDTTHIFMYLYPHVVEKLMPILKNKCKPGTRIVSCDFQDKHREAEEVIPITSRSHTRGKNLFIYVV